jgi:hypothetical protein
MAYTPSLSICEKNHCSDVLLTDSRGLYDSTLNPDGWNGGSNPTNSTITSATVSVLLPNTTTAVDLDVTASVTSATINNYQSIFNLGTYSATDLGTTGKLPDGIYTFTYTIVDGSDTYTSSYKTYLFCQTRCCVDKLLAEIPNRMTDLTFINNVEMANAFLLSASKSAFSCGKFTETQKLVEQAKKICNFYNKTCC